jgi:hypothetical protein
VAESRATNPAEMRKLVFGDATLPSSAAPPSMAAA